MPLSRWTTTNSTPLRSRAPARSRSTRSFRGSRSTSDIWTPLITPNGQVGHEAFAVIREAMRGKDLVGLGRVVLSKRERVIMLNPWDKGLVGTTVRYPYEIRDARITSPTSRKWGSSPRCSSWPSRS
jgi:Ku70/Ku80 beta-barrel domain